MEASANIGGVRILLPTPCLGEFAHDDPMPGPDFGSDATPGFVCELSVAGRTPETRYTHYGRPPAHALSARKLLMVMQRHAASVIVQDGIEAALSPGDIVLVDADRQFSARFQGPSSQLLVYLPAGEVMAEVAGERIRKLAVHSADDPLTMLARPLLTSLLEDQTLQEGSNGDCARRMLVELGRGLIAKQRQPEQIEDRAIPNRRVRDFILANLGRADLTPAGIAHACGISLRRLHRLFAGTGRSVCEWLRHERLKRCHEELRDPRFARQSVTDVAFRWGFSDSAHFSRVFRQAYGRTPSDVRRQAIAPEAGRC